jgi:DNA primase
MDVMELKQYIINNDKIEYILENLGCHDIKSHLKEYRAGLPDRQNKTAIAVKKETLSVKIFQPDEKIIRGDILTLCMTIKNIPFIKASRYLHEILELEYKYKLKKDTKEQELNDPLQIFKRVKNKSNTVNVYDIDLIDENALNDYIPYPHISFIRDGIMPWTCKEFKIGYSDKHKRIVIPHRLWNENEDKFAGIFGRTVVENYELFDIPKYYGIKPYPKSMNLYGLQENYKTIQENGYVVVYEAEKSVLKRHSRKDGTGVAVGSHSLSDEQIKILIGLDVDIIIAYDKDIKEEYIWSECDRFYGIRNVYYIYDKHDLLKEKESPADATNKIFNYLFKYKIKYSEVERKRYIEWREKQGKN